jgi:hypothetical protein
MTETQTETRIELTGWKAIVGLAIVILFAGIRLSMRFQRVPDEGQEAVREWLVKDYEGRGPAALAQVVRDYRAGLPVHAPETPVVVPQVEFVALAAHGSPTRMVVRTEVAVNGAPPPDGRPVRYLSLTTKFGGGWMVTSETNAYNYYELLVR